MTAANIGVLAEIERLVSWRQEPVDITWNSAMSWYAVGSRRPAKLHAMPLCFYRQEAALWVFHHYGRRERWRDSVLLGDSEPNVLDDALHFTDLAIMPEPDTPDHQEWRLSGLPPYLRPVWFQVRWSFQVRGRAPRHGPHIAVWLCRSRKTGHIVPNFGSYPMKKDAVHRVWQLFGHAWPNFLKHEE